MDNISDEFINSYIDGELSHDEQQWLLEQMSTNSALAARVQELQFCKNIVASSFSCDYRPQSLLHRFYNRPALVASIAVVFLFVMGGVLGFNLSNHNSNGQDLMEMAKDSSMQKPVADKPWKVLMQVSSGDRVRMKAVLTETRTLLEKYKDSKRKVEVRIVTNAKGLDMLRKDKSDFADLIAQMQKDYANLTFSACNLAIQAAKEAELVDSIELLPNVRVVPTAVGELLKRQSEGWSYLQI